jgi:hypothetical protein
MYYVYHPHHAPVLLDNEAEYQQYLDNGWYNTPAKFPSNVAAQEPKPIVEEEPTVDAAPKKKGRPPKAKAEDESLSVEL